MGIYEGNFLIDKSTKIAIVVSNFNSLVTSQLLEGCQGGLAKFGLNNVDVYKVPGAFEIPTVVNKLVKNNDYQAIICLGAVIKGETDHYQYVCSGVTNGISKITTETNTPIIFGILMTDTIEQAMNRAGLKAGNKGYECAETAIQMISLLSKIN